MNLRQTLYAWRDNEAAKRGVELFRILPNSALDAIVKALPRTREDLTSIKGIKDAKYQHYGKEILAMVDAHIVPLSADSASLSEPFAEGNDIAPLAPPQDFFSVSAYLDIVNGALWRITARVRGEVTSYKFQGSALYLTLKDAEDQSVMNVFMWKSDYEVTGIEITEGLEVIVEGKSEIYKPSGRFSFRAQTMEQAGVGALKKAYEALKKKLAEEGVFAAEKKRLLPEYPERIGLITSSTGAVIHDFLNNLGKYGFHVAFRDSRVEGAAAVRDLLDAIERFKTMPIDVLVLIRGGGSLESLQAFNNERVVRALAEFPKPTIVAIGHDQDVPLAQLAADFSPSTPTACTALLNAPWEDARVMLSLSARDLSMYMHDRIWQIRSELEASRTAIASQFAELRSAFSRSTQAIAALIPILGGAIVRIKRDSEELIRSSGARYHSVLLVVAERLAVIDREITAHDPFRQLRLGYSILAKKGKVIRSVTAIHAGDRFEARIADGTLEATVERIIRP